MGWCFTAVIFTCWNHRPQTVSFQTCSHPIPGSPVLLDSALVLSSERSSLTPLPLPGSTGWAWPSSPPPRWILNSPLMPECPLLFLSCCTVSSRTWGLDLSCSLLHPWHTNEWLHYICLLEWRKGQIQLYLQSYFSSRPKPQPQFQKVCDLLWSRQWEDSEEINRGN